MTQADLNKFINSYLQCFKAEQYVQELILLRTCRLSTIDHSTVLDKMQQFDLIKSIDRMNGKEWELTPNGHDVLRYGSWKWYRIVKLIKYFVPFTGWL